MSSSIATLLGGAVVAMCFGVVIHGAAHAPLPPRGREIAPSEHVHFAVNVAMNEDVWLRESAQNFPGDAWSQNDDFHAREAARIRELAKERSAAVEDVLQSVDEDLHAGKKSNLRRSTHAVPCKPRPFYD